MHRDLGARPPLRAGLLHAGWRAGAVRQGDDREHLLSPGPGAGAGPGPEQTPRQWKGWHGVFFSLDRLELGHRDRATCPPLVLRDLGSLGEDHVLPRVVTLRVIELVH